MTEVNIHIEVIEVENSEYEDVLFIRNQELRLPLGLNIKDDDISNEKNEIIIVAKLQNRVVGCCLLKLINKEILKLRQMAVLKDFQKNSIGSQIVSFAEKWAKENGYKTIELHARTEVSNFYTSLNYNRIGVEFLEVGIPHYKMIKDII
jgi:predicted GNAT family N-acyltransferase